MEFGARLKKIRQGREISQRELERQSGITQAQISRYEHGESNPSAEATKRLANALNVTVGYLIEGTSQDIAEEQFSDRSLLEQFRKIEQMDEREREVVKIFLDAFIAKKQIQEILAQSST